MPKEAQTFLKMNSPHSPSLEGIDALEDIPTLVEARLGERMIDLQDIGRLQPGSVISLDHAAGETLSVYVGNVRLASAEVIVIEEKLALRITELHSSER